jgi:hypothetical protein
MPHKRIHHDDRFRLQLLNRILLYAGICTLLLSLLFMIIYINKADKVVHTWTPFIVAGVALVIASQISKTRAK